MKSQNYQLKPQDILLLLKVCCVETPTWNQADIANVIGLSQSEVSEAVARTKYSGLLGPDGKKVMKLGLFEFLQYGIRYVFPQHPGPLVPGVPTAHAAPPLNQLIVSDEPYVWPSARGSVRGQAIQPLYPSVVKAVENDKKLYELLALVDALRVGRARERAIAITELEKRILGNTTSQDKNNLLL